jgi:uncharacterized membrane protein
MIRKVSRVDALAVTVLAGVASVTGALYARLPARVPTHFDAHGVANAWMDRAIGAWLLPCVALATWLLLRFAGAIAPRSWRTRIDGTPMSAVGFVLAALLGAMQVLVLYAALNPGEAIGRPLALAFGVFWLALGQLMPRLRRNPFVGIRTAWTLTSDENWLRTHRIAAYTFAAGGLVALVAGAIGGRSAPPVAIGAVLVSALVPAVYSYVIARQLPPGA